jgi:DNA-binding beta-propeller fold protein YncE
MKRKLSVVLVSTFIAAGLIAADPAAPLKLAARYKMPDTVTGRFDHLGADVRGNRLFLAAETAHEVLVFNLRTGEYLRAIPDIQIPHAIFVREDLSRIFVTDGGAGDVKIFDGRDYKLIGTVKLKLDSDSIGYDPATHYLYVDNGGGDAHESFSMLSVIDTTHDTKVADIQIDGDTLEAMALDKSSPLMYVNNPARNSIDVVNRDTRKVETTWPVTTCKRNVAMALDDAAHRLFTACRSGAIDVLDAQSGKELQSLPIPQGVDDLIFDPETKRLYAACRNDSGVVAVYQEADADHYSSLGTIASGPGSKNEVLVAPLRKLFVTIPPSQTLPGEVFVYDLE